MNSQQLFDKWETAKKEASVKLSEASEKLNMLYDEQKNNIDNYDLAHRIHIEIMTAHDDYQKAWGEYLADDELYTEYQNQTECEARIQMPYVEQDYYSESREMARLQALAGWR